jgi:kynureninase
MPEALRRPILALLENEYGRLLRVEADKARRAANSGQLSHWAAGYYDAASEERVAAQLAPIVGAAAGSAGKAAAWSAAVARRLAADHNAAGRADPSPASLANGRGAAQAARHLDLIWEALTNEKPGN